MKHSWVPILAILLLTGCSTANGADRVGAEVAAQETAAALANVTPLPPTASPEPTSTPKPPVSCPDSEVQTYLDELDLLLEEWSDTHTRAGTTSRISLSPIVGELQTIRRNARRLDRPECANYLQELIVVAMDRDIDAFIAFLGQESDTVVSRKISGAERAWAAVNSEIEAFKTDPLAAYLATTTTASELQAQLDQPVPFTLPEGWRDQPLAPSQCVISLPEAWTHETYGDSDQYSRLKSEDGALTVMGGVFSEKFYGELDTDAGRLFALQSALETQGYDYYLEQSAESGVYSLNRGYVVEFSVRESGGDEIEDQIWAIIITPEGDEGLLMVSTTRDDFAQVDMLTLNQIFGSIRRQ